ncbi:MAG: hypothetical protein KJ053_10735 [Dehalococcoidia bacterium]|nr:hypothetical protein [Dehalococcoidia bacterium]
MIIDPITVQAFQPSTSISLEARYRAEFARKTRDSKPGPRAIRIQPDADSIRARWLANAGRFVRLA